MAHRSITRYRVILYIIKIESLIVLITCFLTAAALSAAVAPRYNSSKSLESLPPSPKGYGGHGGMFTFFVNFDAGMLTQRYNPEYAATHKNWQKVHALYEEHILNNFEYALTPRIPKTIHQIWLGSPLPEKYYALQQTWLEHHPDWEYRLWTDKEVEALNLINKKAYNKSTNYGQKSDIARYEILYRFGGLYVDTDFECLRAFDELHHCCDFYVGLSCQHSPHIINALIGAAPGHPILKECIHAIKRGNYKGGGFVATQNNTGPGLLTRSFLKCAGTAGTKDVAFPSSYFYPWPWYERDCNTRAQIMAWVRPETFALHHWHVSWNDGKTY